MKFLWKKKETTVEQDSAQARQVLAASEEKAAETGASGGTPENLSLKVLGAGCARCRTLTANVQAALQELGWTAQLEHVTDFAQIAAYGVMSTPALVLGERVLASGKVLSKAEVKEILQSEQ